MSTAGSITPTKVWILQLPKATNSLRSSVNLEGTLGLSIPKCIIKVVAEERPP